MFVCLCLFVCVCLWGEGSVGCSRDLVKGIHMKMFTAKKCGQQAQVNKCLVLRRCVTPCSGALEKGHKNIVQRVTSIRHDPFSLWSCHIYMYKHVNIMT